MDLQGTNYTLGSDAKWLNWEVRNAEQLKTGTEERRGGSPLVERRHSVDSAILLPPAAKFGQIPLFTQQFVQAQNLIVYPTIWKNNLDTCFCAF